MKEFDYTKFSNLKNVIRYRIVKGERLIDILKDIREQVLNKKEKN